MNCESLDGEFSELSTFPIQARCHSFHGLSLPWSVAYFNALWISRRWVQWITSSLKQMFVSCSLCGLFLQYTVAHFNAQWIAAHFNAQWITRRWVQWNPQLLKTEPLCLDRFVIFLVMLFLLVPLHLRSTRRWVRWLVLTLEQTSMSHLYCGLSLPCSVSHFNSFWITRWWVQWITHFLKQVFLFCSFCGFPLPCSVTHFNALLAGEFC